MNDLISRKAAIDALGDEPEVWCGETGEYAVREQWRADVSAIKAVPSAEPEWIHVSERLPDKRATVIVSCIDNSGDTLFSYTACGYWVGVLPDDDPTWIVDDEINYHVVAWMPLPEPCKEGESE